MSSAPCGSPRSLRTLAKPKPWISPKAKATIQRRPCTRGNTLFSAARTTEVAIADSTSREGSEITPSAARLSVIECATVNEVTILNTSQNAGGNRATACQRPPSSTSTAGRSSDSRNRIWSKPITEIGERGDDLEHHPERRGKPGDGLPASPVEHEHRRQEQRRQEQDMVEADHRDR